MGWVFGAVRGTAKLIVDMSSEESEETGLVTRLDGAPGAKGAQVEESSEEEGFDLGGATKSKRGGKKCPGEEAGTVESGAGGEGAGSAAVVEGADDAGRASWTPMEIARGSQSSGSQEGRQRGRSAGPSRGGRSSYRRFKT